jgi:hypothetical protein
MRSHDKTAADRPALVLAGQWNRSHRGLVAQLVRGSAVGAKTLAEIAEDLSDIDPAVPSTPGGNGEIAPALRPRE